MAKVLVHLPLNISRAIEEMLKDFGREMKQKHGIKLEVENLHKCMAADEKSKDMRIDNAPDLLVGNANYILKFAGSNLEEHIRPLPGRFPLRPELAKAGFADSRGYFHPFVIVPFAIFYNPNVVREGELPQVWADLLDASWREKILMPAQHHMAPKMIQALIQAYYPEKIAALRQNMVFDGAPINVVNAVDEGRYPLGITNVTFARVSRNKNISMLWPRDGLFCMPLVMVWNKKADDRLLEIGDYLLSSRVQEYLALQTFVPVSTAVNIPQVLIENNFNLIWRGWDDFINVLKGVIG
ncbi:MAG: ABC transporter substrate-binding protein [Desulfotomaculaceae bacterium]|nr:ABC transporter substrate-binding protein [Desulfotomaculaceae bacterium]